LEGALEITVTDTGIGIPVDKQELIFQMFSQADSSSIRQFGGTGLGLAICKGLIELMGGKIGVRSKPAEGSVFWFTLPLKTAVRQEAEPVAEEASDLVTGPREFRILLVEDNPLVSDVIVRILSRQPWEITTAGTGRDAIQKWRGGDFDLILMDVQMPDMDGLEATHGIRELEKLAEKRIVIIGLTAHAGAAVYEECRAAGMDDVLVKPIEPTRLYATINRCLAGRYRLIEET
jgi:CheY-like chemotaxis protein